MQSYKDLNIDYQDGELDIDNLSLDSLAGCPDYITGSFICEHNKLSNLIGGPQKVDKNYWCGYNGLTALDGCASHIGGELNLCDNQITSLVGIHKIVKSCREIFLDPDKIIEGGIGLLLIDNLNWISIFHSEPFHIIQKYLGKGTKGMMECRSELISYGYSDHAKL